MWASSTGRRRSGLAGSTSSGTAGQGAGQEMARSWSGDGRRPVRSWQREVRRCRILFSLQTESTLYPGAQSVLRPPRSPCSGWCRARAAERSGEVWFGLVSAGLPRSSVLRYYWQCSEQGPCRTRQASVGNLGAEVQAGVRNSLRIVDSDACTSLP